jgi:DNA-directed RNA polymerase specialized sigma24 family protein
VTAARRQSLRTRQRETREVLTDEPIGEELPAPNSTDERLLQAERASALRDAVRRLPTRQRDLLEALMSTPDCSYAEVARTLDMPVGSIGPTRERGLSRLRRDERLSRIVTG